MKIKELRLTNFAKFEDFELVFNDDITHLIGMNGDGKTTVGLTAIWAGFKGIAEKGGSGQLIGERFKFIGDAKKTADIEILIYDENTDDTIVLKRHITKTQNQISIKPNSDKVLTKDYVENLFNAVFMSATYFTGLTGYQQAEAMGIDTTKHDAKIIGIKDEATGIRRDIKKIGEPVKVKKVEKQDIDDLYEERKIGTAHNEGQALLAKQKVDYNKELEDNDTERVRLTEVFNADMARLKAAHIFTHELLQELPEAVEAVDLDATDEKIKNIVANNELAVQYETYISTVQELKDLDKQLDENKNTLEHAVNERLNYLQSKTFGIKEMNIDEKGQLTYKDKLIRLPYFSKGEIEMIVARIASSLNPELKVRFIDDFELLDEVNQEKIVRNLTKKGFQIITASVGNKRTGDNSVLLKACQVADADQKNIPEERVAPVKKTRKGSKINVNHPPVDLENPGGYEVGEDGETGGNFDDSDF